MLSVPFLTNHSQCQIPQKLDSKAIYSKSIERITSITVCLFAGLSLHPPLYYLALSYHLLLNSSTASTYKNNFTQKLSKLIVWPADHVLQEESSPSFCLFPVTGGIVASTPPHSSPPRMSSLSFKLPTASELMPDLPDSEAQSPRYHDNKAEN